MNLSTLVAHKRHYINRISNGINELLCHYQILDDSQVNSQLVALIQDASHHYLRNTALTLKPNHRAFILQTIINIEKLKRTFNDLPGDKGVYELVGLANPTRGF